MPTLSITIPSSLDVALRNTAAQSHTSPDNLVSAALSEYLGYHRPRIFQISTSAALVEGVDQGAVSSRVLLEHGDFGLGTFAGKDGEMVVLDGVIYQVRDDGSVNRRQDDFSIPFAVVTRFQEEATFKTGKIRSLKDLQLACDPHRESENLFYALRAEGVFETVHTRVLSPVPAGTGLVEAARAQAEFHFRNVQGTLVCIWSPSYSSAFNVPGYHFHFISNDRTKGGHVLDCTAETLVIGLQMLCEYDVRLPREGTFLTARLSKDPSDDLAKVE